jgi:hypothetical protein
MNCEVYFCSTNCFGTHLEHKHKNSTENESKSNNNRISLKVERKSTLKSPFIKFGDYLKEYKNENLYSFKNFEFLKLGEQFHVIGSGTFGDVFLAKNKIDRKYYAIKQVI